MRIMIESDQNITELHIKFADSGAKVDVVQSDNAEQMTKQQVKPKSTPISKPIESVVDSQKSVKSSKKETVAKTAPTIDIPSIEGREVKVDDGMNENF